MILVYTNSKERAMLLATCIDGVILKNKTKVRAANYAELHDQLEQELSKDGYIRTFFQGNACTFVYSDGTPCAPNKMVDYDPAFADIKKRPIPFIPESFVYHYIDKAFEQRLPLYKKMCEDATIIVNAASDDVDGEIAFEQFSRLFNGTRKQVFRARPIAMTETSIIEAFNALEDIFHREAFSNACYLYEMLNWLVSCNASNALTSHNFERRFMVAGRLESLVLSFVAKRQQQCKHNRYVIEVCLSNDKNERIKARVITEPTIGEQEAKKIAKECERTGSARVEKTEFVQFTNKPELLNAFSLQAKAAEDGISLTATQTIEAMLWLYNNGLITWPSQSVALPWSANPRFTNAITTLSQNADFQDKVLPRDIDYFLDWDCNDPLFGHIGILVTERPVPQNIPAVYYQVYKLIASANIVSIKMKVLTSIHNASFSCGSYKLNYCFSSQKYVDLRGNPAQAGTTIHENDLLHIDDVQVKNECVAEPYTEAELLNDIAYIFKDSFCYSANKFSSAIENLVSWGQIERNGSKLTMTESGRLAYKYLAGTSLTDADKVSSWDRRLFAIVQGKTDAASFESDLKVYVEDLCGEIVDKATDICTFGGKDISELQCPVCNSKLLMTEGGGCKCSGQKCNFNIPPTLLGHTMSKLDISQLLSRGRTDLIKDFASKNGAYSARLVMDKSGKISRTFLSLHKCPFCGQQMNEYAWGVKCMRCHFALNTTVCGHKLTDKELHLILSHESTDFLHLVNSAGKSFVAKLSLAEDKTLKFSFPEKKP